MKTLSLLFLLSTFAVGSAAQDGAPPEPNFDAETDAFFTTDHSVATLPTGFHIGWIEPNTVAISGQRVPSGATHYYYRGQSIQYLGGEINPTTWPVSPRLVESIATFALPQGSLPELGRRFEGRPEAANHALLELLDEPIGPLSLDTPMWTALSIEESFAKEVMRSKFSAIQAIFDNAAKPDRKAVSANVAWVGRCAFRTAPAVETGALLVLRVKDQRVIPHLTTAATAVEIAGNKDSAQPNKYTDLGEPVIEVAKPEVVEEVRYSRLSDRSLNERSNDGDSLFFETKRVFSNGIQQVGFRLRSFSGTSKKQVLVLEAYSPFRDGASFADKRIDFLEPVQYCYFTKAYHW